MTKLHLAVSLLIAGCLASSAFAAELGRRPIKMTGPRGGSQPGVVIAYGDIMSEGSMGLELDLLWNSADWEVGSTNKYDDTPWGPRVSLFYGVSDSVDIRVCAKYLSLKDDTGELDALRIGVGAKAWLSSESDFTPYLGLLINYYNFVDGKVSNTDISSIDGTFGGSLEAGVAYLLADTFLVRVGLQGETLFGDADAGPAGDISFSALSFGVGATVLF